MINKLRELIAKNSSGKKVALLFVLTNLIYAFMLLVTIPKTVAYSGGVKLLDMMPQGYDSEYVNDLFSKLGKEGRDVFYRGDMARVIGDFMKENGGFLSYEDISNFYLCLIPIIAGIADYLENIGIITMLNDYPDLSIVQISSTNIFSIIKSVSTTLFFIVLIVIIILGNQD